MHNVVTLGAHTPQLEAEIFIADTARVIGKVFLAKDVSVWYGAVIRGDADEIRIESGTNVQDNVVIHVDPGAPAHIGSNCIIGHGAIIHGCTLENNVLVGMHATILNGCVIGAYSIIGANALVTSNTVIPPNSLVLGSPAKVVGAVDEKGKIRIEANAAEYLKRAKEYLARLE